MDILSTDRQRDSRYALCRFFKIWHPHLYLGMLINMRDIGTFMGILMERSKFDRQPVSHS